MRIDKDWIRAHLPEDCADEPIDVFSGYYVDGLKEHDDHSNIIEEPRPGSIIMIID